MNKSMNVLGVGHDLWISAAALLRDGRVLSAVCEERLNRAKGFKGFPDKAIDACLASGNLALDDIDLIVCGWNPVWHMESPHGRYSGSTRWRPEYLYAVPNLLLPKAQQFPFGPVQQRFGEFKAPIIFLDHQMAHAASAYYLSGYEEAAVFTADGRGERHTGLLGKAKNNKIEVIDRVTYPHSLGLFYSLVTQYLGFKPHSDEWKVMALASYSSDHNNPYYERLKKMVEVNSSGVIELDLKICGYLSADSYGSNFFTPKFTEMMGIPERNKNEELEKEHYQLAWSLQRVFEDTMDECLRKLHAMVETDNLVLAGGCMMNSVYNGKIEKNTPFKNVYIPSCPDDSGIPIGAALWGYYEHLGRAEKHHHPHNYWGPEFSDQEIEKVLVSSKLSFERLTSPSEYAAREIAAGKLVGWFQGAMEFGQRSLGHRSILADPRNPDAKSIVNSAVKFREGFRPFAPAVLSERAHEYFDVAVDTKVPFMEKVYMFKPEMAESVPAVVHVDGSGRLQTVEKEHSPDFHALISAFCELTGVPIVLNTSFNLNNEPVVCSPEDAIRSFFTCGLDTLIVGPFVVKKGA